MFACLHQSTQVPSCGWISRLMLRLSSFTFKTLRAVGHSGSRTRVITLLILLRWYGLSCFPDCCDNPPQDSAHSETNPVGHYKANPTYTLVPQGAIDYAWDYPAAKEKKILLMIDGWRRPVDILEIGNLMPFKFGVRSIGPPKRHSNGPIVGSRWTKGSVFGCSGRRSNSDSEDHEL